MKPEYHIPVMLKETLNYLNPVARETMVDATVGTGGHSLAILERLLPAGRLIAIDRDEESLEIAKERLSNYRDCAKFIYGNFKDMDSLLEEAGIEKIDGVLFDLGISSFQLGDSQRGFSFQNEGPLDMRMDRNSQISAYDLVNNLNAEEISDLLWNFGEERWHNRIARFLVRERQRQAITSTGQLAALVLKATPYKYRFGRIHPATRTFQALRIAVNRELETLEIALEKAVGLLHQQARICVISFHSLEDRIVKLTFRRLAASGLLNILTSKPLTPGDDEIKNNPSSRSAKLRVAERL